MGKTVGSSLPVHIRDPEVAVCSKTGNFIAFQKALSSSLRLLILFCKIAPQSRSGNLQTKITWPDNVHLSAQISESQIPCQEQVKVTLTLFRRGPYQFCGSFPFFCPKSGHCPMYGSVFCSGANFSEMSPSPPRYLSIWLAASRPDSIAMITDFISVGSRLLCCENTFH